MAGGTARMGNYRRGPTFEMITLRTYPSSIEAGLAKAHLAAAGIDCELADENTNSNTGAQLAIPIRLMVVEDRVEEARKILDSQATAENVPPNNE